MAIPGHAFMLWLAFRDVLSPKDRMCKWGYGGNNLRLFCHGNQESRDHLFFHCSLSRRIWRELMASCMISDPEVEWEDVAAWSTNELKALFFFFNVFEIVKTEICLNGLKNRKQN
jgi:hypothetical protein